MRVVAPVLYPEASEMCIKDFHVLSIPSSRDCQVFMAVLLLMAIRNPCLSQPEALALSHGSHKCTCMYTHAQAHRPHRHCFWPSSPFDTDSVSFRPCGEDSVDSAGGGAVILKDTERRWSELKVGTSFRFYFCHFWFEATS